MVEPKPFSSIPGPWPSLPFIGTRWQFFPLIGCYDLNQLHEVHIERYHLYGPIFQEHYQWDKSIVHIYDPKDFAIVFSSQGRYPIRPPNEFVTKLRLRYPDRYPTVGLSNLNGEEWRIHRNKLSPAIVKLKTMDQHISHLNEVCDDFLDYIFMIKNAETDVINIQEATYKFALESICVICLGTRIGCFNMEVEKDADQLIDATKLLFDSFNELYFGAPLWKYFTTNGFNKLEQAESRIYEIASKYVEKAIDDMYDEEENCTVLKKMLTSTGLSVKEVKINIIDFIAGGIFTISNTLAYLFYHLAMNQNVQQKLYDEICHITANQIEITQTQLNQMTYLKYCLKECFRITCPIPGVVRVTSEPLVLSNYYVPANTVVLSHTRTTCLLEDYFSEPKKFKPERWMNRNENERLTSYAVLPFGYGTRTCVGKRLSEMEIYMLVAKMIQKYRIELATEKQENLKLVHHFLVIPAEPISLRIVSRN